MYLVLHLCLGVLACLLVLETPKVQGGQEVPYPQLQSPQLIPEVQSGPEVLESLDKQRRTSSGLKLQTSLHVDVASTKDPFAALLWSGATAISS